LPEPHGSFTRVVRVEIDSMDEVFDRYLKLLGKTEWAPYPQLLRYQQGLLERLVQHGHANVPFYRDRLACLLTGDGSIDLSRWREVPILTRADATAHTDQMRARELPESYGPIQEFQTSGSSGVPLRFSVDAPARTAYNATLTRLARWFGVDTSRPLAQIRVFRTGETPRYPDGISSKGWSRAHPNADVHNLDLRTPVEQQIDWLLRQKCPYLMTLPSNATAIAYAATPAQARALEIEIIFSISETVVSRARKLVAERLGARLVGIYSCEEVGMMATECPAAAHYHEATENVLVEIVDDDGRPAAAGQPGRVLVTGLSNYATPFIRYDIGDTAMAALGPCSCGRSLPVISQVLGRTRNAFVFKDGKRVWLRIWDEKAIQACVPCRELQMVQLDHEKFELRYVPDGSNRVPDRAGLDTFVREKLHPSAKVALVPMETIPRGPGGKLDPFISMVTD
jgi:phenylacetate-CoA ligase